jgi:asparagine synthase (glutamine-hydrolysing)
MCGILGSISLDGSPASIPSLELLRHRGPDGQADWSNASRTVYLGHTRLAILEPTPAGRQPMQDASGRFTITFNGEIYNHLALRTLLPEVRWKSGSDTETLVELIAARGASAFRLLKGMFAFAVHDAADDTVWLVRDRLGIKPLWVYQTSTNLFFSSEVRALPLETPLRLKPEALSEFIAFGRMPGSGPIALGITSLSPGSWMRLSPDGQQQNQSWWPEDDFHPFHPRNQAACVAAVRQFVQTAIEEHLISDVGVGAFLSGGIDSSVVALVAGERLGKNLQTFTIGFPQRRYDERTVAKQVAQKIGSEHHELEINERDCLEWVQEAVEYLDLPSVDAINTYIVSKAVRRTGLKVALSGLGGDELFGGYPSFTQVPFLRALRSVPAELRNRLVRVLPSAIRSKLRGIPDFEAGTLTIARRRFTSVDQLHEMGLLPGMPQLPPPPPGLSLSGQISWAELQGYTIPMLLRDSDQMSMATGLEIRVPFLDHALVEQLLTLPDRFKRGHGVKPLLVEAFHQELPTDVYNRPKQGFALPMQEWMGGPLADFAAWGAQAASDTLGLTLPRQQLMQFQQGRLHWTRAWHWAVLGHWLARQQISSLVFA